MFKGGRIMTDEELFDWYAKNKNSKPEGMTDKDYELTMNKALKLQQYKLLTDNLNSQQNLIKKQQIGAEQSASISNEKLLKYIGQRQKSSGLASGQTSSDFIKANNNYIANRAIIANNAASQEAELLNSYAANKLQNESDSYINEMNILDKYYTREVAEDERRIADEERVRDNAIEDKNLAREEDKWLTEKEAYNNEQIISKQDKAYSEIMTVIESGAFNSVSELESLFELYKDNLSASQEKIVQHMIDYYKNNPQQQEIESENSK